MSLLKKIKDALSPPVPEECREESYDAVLKNLDILSKESSELKALMAEFDEGKITQEQCIATGVAIITKELLEFRYVQNKIDSQAW
ncbi:hypothetical protein [Klebsiella aerogenes]|uniref:hypothetical protein n=1 Tax=Klebsiella aerogenes TaxID=548 RepID=UPI0005F067B3|nr:hypothetical protein [Klebsiella aerogenes]ATY02242.1 hypothetical protein AM334_16245 [Klebsiella aerogenes]EKQ6527486.1 hypothetical protein [Klebsiella aerogenes]EKU0355696.1 hypothetical protein [Klebsiella aerogenes]EKU7555372.1 hypothetical protein [Klebsiella aerogenes]EKV7123477.1 hypothetical protein [Klebsiella aerogenes]